MVRGVIVKLDVALSMLSVVFVALSLLLSFGLILWNLHSSGILVWLTSCSCRCSLHAGHGQGNFGYLHSPCFLVCLRLLG